MNRFLTSRLSRFRLAVLIGVIAAAASGCPSVRVVSQQDSSGVIAIPANTDMWPFRYRSKAEALLAQQCPEGYVIELEEEYVTGQTTRIQEDHQENEHQVSKRVSLSTGSSSTTATTSDQKEWRIHYRKKSADVVEEDESLETLEYPKE